MMEDKKELVDASGLDTKIVDLTNQILNEDNPEAAKDLVALFNWNMSKKNVSRIIKLNGLLDDVSDQMVIRFRTRADQFTNSDLIDYMKTIQGAIDTSTKNLTQVEQPPVIMNQTNIQINGNIGDSFDRDAKERILAAVQATLRKAQTFDGEATVIESLPEDDEETND